MQYQTNRYIIIADNDDAFLANMKLFLEAEGFHVITAKDGESVLKNANKGPLLILINVNLPILDGWRTAALLKNSYSTSAIPIIFLSDKYSENDEVLSFELGGINYITKPIAPKIIITQIKKLIDQRFFPQNSTIESKNLIKAGKLEIDTEHLIVRGKGRSIKLTKKELQLLTILVSNKNRVISRNAIFQEIWGRTMEKGNRNIDILILRIRKKLRDMGNLIKSISRVGYKLELKDGN